MPRGGTISTRVMNSPAATRLPIFDRSASGAGGVSVTMARARLSRPGGLLGIHGADGGLHRADVVGRGAATSADELHAGANEFAREAGHVLRRAEIDVTAVYVARHAGIGHGDQRKLGNGAHALDRREHCGRAGGTVDADGICAGACETRRGDVRWCAVETVGVFIHGHHGQQRNVRSYLPGRVDGLFGFVDGHHRLDREQVHAHARSARDQAFDLFCEGGARLFQGSLAQRFQVNAERADRTGDVRSARLLVCKLGDGFPRQPRACLVDGAGLILQPESLQAKAVRPEGVGFDDLGAGLQIFLMHGADQLRLGQVQLVEALVEEDAPPIERGSHGPVTEDRPAGEE